MHLCIPYQFTTIWRAYLNVRRTFFLEELSCKTTYLGKISSKQSTVRWHLDHHQMALWSVPTIHLLEPLVKQNWVLTARGRQPMKFVVYQPNVSKIISVFNPLHRGAFSQFLFRWIHYYHSSKSTGKETGKTHLCVLLKFVTILPHHKHKICYQMTKVK